MTVLHMFPVANFQPFSDSHGLGPYSVGILGHWASRLSPEDISESTMNSMMLSRTLLDYVHIRTYITAEELKRTEID